MRRGFVFGKFYPFHLGHAALIDFALLHCDTLSVLVCASNKESLPLELRCNWLRHHYASHSKVTIVPLAYREEELPNTSVSSREVSRVWAQRFSQLLPEVRVLFTSEPYGAFVADYMQIAHCSFDQARSIVPVAASLIRQHPLRYWDYLPPVVRSHYVRKVVLNGTESTGKSRLCQQLATHFNTVQVAESAREIVSRSPGCTRQQLQQIAQVHATAIEAQLPGANKLLFIDTDVHLTCSYSRFLFGEELPLTDFIRQQNRADLMFFLDKDVPFVQDGTRLDHRQRQQLHQSHLQLLEEEGINYHLIQGSWQQRFQQMVRLVEERLL